MDATDLSITHLSEGDLAGDRIPLPRPGMPGATPIQMWVLDDGWLSAAERAFAGTLSADERSRAAQFRQRCDALRFVARRGLLRHLLARYRECDPRDLRFVADAHGKPALSSPSGPPLQFSVAQTDGAMVLAFAGARPVGVDVQCPKPGLALDDIAAEVFSARERADMRLAAPQLRACRFFATWARKEALLKALGVGLLTDAVQYTTRAAEGSLQWRAWHGSREFRGWTLRDLPLGPSLHAAVAVQPSAT